MSTFATVAPIRPRWPVLLYVVAVLWHLAAVTAPPAVPPPRDSAGRDFASYYYAARVASDGGDPYEKASLDALAQADETRDEVHPFFYPPPFLWLVAFSPGVDLQTGFRLWWLLNEGALLGVCLVLERWFRPLSAHAGPVIAVLAAAMYGVAYSAELGQANFPVLLAVLVGLSTERRWPVAAGVAVGLAAMWKMSPALVVGWWLVQRRTTAVAAAVATAVGSSLLTLPLLGLSEQVAFYRDVLPGLQRGEYNGLKIQIGMFANHSAPNLFHQIFPSGANVLSAAAGGASTAFQIALAATLGWWFRSSTRDPLRLAAQGSAVLVAALLIPVYTYEHHLVFALPAMVLSVLAVVQGHLPRWCALPIALAVAVLCFDLPSVRAFAAWADDARLIRLGVQEAKTVALVAVGATNVWLGATAEEDSTRPPPPRPAAG